VPAVSQYLVTAITNATMGDPLPILVKLGDPGVNVPNDVVIIGEVRRTVDQLAYVGSGAQFFLQEQYDITISTTSWSGTGDSDDTNTVSVVLSNRAWQLVAYLETAIRTDPSLGGLVLVAFPRESASAGPVWTTNPVGLQAQVDVVIHVEATL
jgi:hypothetical protein